MRFFFLALLLFAMPAYAQTPLDSYFPALTISLSDEYPTPRASIVASVHSNTVDLRASEVEWYVDSTLITEGPGRTSTNLTVGEADTRIVVVATTPQGVVSTERVVRPGSADILWEATSYAHPLYRGRRLASPGSTVKADARARLLDSEGRRIPYADIVFTWKKNDAVMQSISGRGRSQVTFPAPQLFSTDTISVEAASLDQRTIARSTVRIRAEDPSVSLYRVDPLYGILFHAALGPSASIPDSETTVAAFPFFSTEPRNPSLEYSWKVNGQRVSPSVENPHYLTINADDSSGSARVELQLGHLTNFLLDARGTWNLVFNSIANPFNPFSGTQ